MNCISQLRHQDPRTRTYLGSPSIVRLLDGSLLATHDYFGPGCPRNHEGEEHLTSVYRSQDDGVSWRNITHISGQYWSSLFVHGGSPHILGTSAQYGSIVVRRSADGGFTWSHPKDETTGLLFRGGAFHDPPNYHCAPMPVVLSGGRIWRAFEDCDPLKWGVGFRALVISADEDADLLQASNWRMTNRLPYDQRTDPPQFGRNSEGGAGWLEGNVVEDPDGRLWNVMRVHSAPVLNKAAMVRILDDGARLEFDPEAGFIDFPGGMSKFTIRRDPQTGFYWTLSNDMEDAPDGRPRIRRNRLSIFASSDLRTWRKRRTLLEDSLESDPERSVKQTGFQYVDWQFDREDLIYLVRTAYDGAHSFHDSNRITFHRVRDFRSLLEEEGRHSEAFSPPPPPL